jgi:hypothetical protein
MTQSKYGLVFVLVAACGGSPKQEAVPEPAVEAPAAAVHYEETPPVTIRVELPKPFEETAHRGDCDVHGTAAPPPKGLVATVESDVYEVREGEKSEVIVVLTNTTEAGMVAEFDASCAFANMVDLSVHDRGGTRLDRVSQSCEVDAPPLCSGHVVRVELDPGGNAFLRLAVTANVTVLSKKCDEHEGRALSPGRYLLRFQTAFANKPPSPMRPCAPASLRTSRRRVKNDRRRATWRSAR